MVSSECARPRAQHRDTAKIVGETESDGALNIAVAEDGHTPETKRGFSLQIWKSTTFFFSLLFITRMSRPS